jgi:hypothetical protein
VCRLQIPLGCRSHPGLPYAGVPSYYGALGDGAGTARPMALRVYAFCVSRSSSSRSTPARRATRPPWRRSTGGRRRRAADAPMGSLGRSSAFHATERCAHDRAGKYPLNGRLPQPELLLLRSPASLAPRSGWRALNHAGRRGPARPPTTGFAPAGLAMRRRARLRNATKALIRCRCVR